MFKTLNRPSAVTTEPGSAEFRSLIRRWRSDSAEQPLAAIAITACDSNASDRVAADLASAAAESGELQVAVIGLNPNGSRLPELFKAEDSTKANAWVEHPFWNSNALATSFGNLSYVDLTPLAAGELDATDQRSMEALLEELLASNVFVIAELPDMIDIEMTCCLASLFPTAVLVVQHGVTKRKTLGEAVERLRRMGIDVLGCVFCRAADRKS